jgi:hypothetical protein
LGSIENFTCLKEKNMKRGNKNFKSLVKEYFNAYIERFPEYGSYLGLHKYDGRWSHEGLEAYLQNIDFFKNYRKRFDRIREKELTKEENLDRKIIIHDLNSTIFGLNDLRLWESDPDIAEGIGSLIFVLLARETIPSDRIGYVLNKALEGIPFLFEQAKTRILKPYKLWTEIAIDSCRGLKSFLNNLKLLKIKNFSKGKLFKNISLAMAAVESYEKFLQKQTIPKSVNKYTIGRENFNKLIKTRELGLDIEDMLAIGERALSADKEELKEIAGEINSKLTLRQVEEMIDGKHLENFKKIIVQYRGAVAKAKNFIKTHNLMEVPDNEEVSIRETPSFMANTTPFAAYFSPPKFAKRQVGIYIITPPLKGVSLKKHNYAGVFNTSVHEAYPGHHLQLVVGSRNPSVARILSSATEMVEGWAFYCEEYMRDVGFDNTDEVRFIQTRDEIWRAARVIIDIKLHSGKMNFNQAVDFLVKQTNMERENAVAEVKRYTKSPSYQLSYMIGKYLIKKLKREIQEKMGEKYSDRFFHQVILKAGSIPIKYLKEEFDLKLNN